MLCYAATATGVQTCSRTPRSHTSNCRKYCKSLYGRIYDRNQLVNKIGNLPDKGQKCVHNLLLSVPAINAGTTI